MPSVYITARNSGEAIPLFKKKGIPDSMPGAASEIPIIVQAPFYSLPSRLFKFIVLCMMTHLPVLTSTISNFSLFVGITQLTRIFEVPVVSLRFKNLSPEEITELKGMGLMQDLTNANIFVGTPATHLLKRIMEIGPIEDRIRPGKINHEGFYAWVFLMKGIQIYTTTRQRMVRASLNVISAGHIAPASSGDATAYDNSTVKYTNAHMTMEVANFQGDFLVLPTGDEQKDFPGSFIDVSSLPSFADKKAIFFPFFIGMSVMDKHTCADVFTTLFQGALSPSSSEGDARMVGKIRSGCRQLSFSRTGMVMAHVYKVFSLAEQVCGAKVHVLTKGAVYAGIIVEGEFSVSLYGRTTVAGDITEDLGRINLMESQAGEVASLLNSATDAGGNSMYTFSASDFLHSRRALTCWLSTDPDAYASSTARDKAKTILENMEYNDVYPQPTALLIQTAVQYIETGDRSLLDNHVAYLGGGMLNSSSRVWEALSIFGPKVPTCNTGDSKGTLIVFPAANANDGNITRVDGQRPLQYLPFWVVPLAHGANQWTTMFSKGVLSIPKGRGKKKEFTDLHKVVVQIGADPMFSAMYASMKVIANDYRRVAEGSGKRKRSGDGDEDKKGKKAKVDVDGL